MSQIKTAITYDVASSQARAQLLAAKLNLPLVAVDSKDYTYLLVFTANHLELRETKSKNTKPIVVDFLADKFSYRVSRGGAKKELIAKAVGVKGQFCPSVVDATAGLGADTFILASLGCAVTMLERSPIIGAMLEDGLTRLFASAAGNKLKIKLQVLQSIDFINNILCMKNTRPDVIYLDPMYPERVKSALGKKEMRILREIVGEDQDADELFAAALKVATKRVVVKRPKLAPALGNKKPDVVISVGKSSRFDVYLILQ